MRKLTTRQIDDLMAFTKQHFVEYYDLQLELTDHLANDIEHIWEEKPEISFEEARQLSFKKFGIFGFLDIVEQKRKSMTKRYLKLFLKLFLEYFTFPKVTLTLLLSTVLFTILKLSPSFNKDIIFYSFLSIGIIALLKVIQYHFYIKKKQKKEGKIWLFESISNTLPISFQIILQILLNNKLLNTQMLSEHLAITSFTIVISAIICYIFLEIIPGKIKQNIQKEYPNYQVY